MNFFEKIGLLKQGNDLIIAIGLIVVLTVMIVPIHPVILDLFLASTFALSFIILLLAIYTIKPLDFSTFPSVLLLMTLFRLSLNVASTRNILLRSQSEGLNAAGDIIKSFGSFVVGGNFAVGIIIFIILVVINFIVITKGAGRVAEVGARFTLDAMPGKQMAIDADLNAGLINEEQAKKRREQVAQEADFYGSMDGSSKFVRGDAIAGILITAINIVGGIIIGVAQYDLSFQEAVKIFTLLTVGDGLVSQIPSIIISTAAGIIITRNTTDYSLGHQFTEQFQIHPKAIHWSGVILLFFAAIPNLPKLPFITVGLFLVYLAKKIETAKAAKESDKKTIEVQEKKATSENLQDLLPVEAVELEIGYGLVSLVDSEQNGDLLQRLTHIRKQFALDWGIIVPSVRIKDNLELRPGSYSIKIKGMEVAKGELMPDHFLAMDSGTAIEKIDGIDTTEPVFGLPAMWISSENKEQAQYNGHTVVDLSTIITTHLTEVIKNNLHELLGRQELSTILETYKEKYPKVVTDLIPDILPLGTVLKVLQNLLKEGISIRDLRSILESLSEFGTKTKDSEQLTEYVRQTLYRTITESVKGTGGEISVFTLDKNVEEMLANHVIQTEQGSLLSIDPKFTQNLLAGLNEKIEDEGRQMEKVIILCSPIIRRHFKKLTEKFIPNLMVIGHDEISPDVNIRSLGTIRA